MPAKLVWSKQQKQWCLICRVWKKAEQFHFPRTCKECARAVPTTFRSVSGEKQCKLCGKWKPVSGYYKHPSTRDRLFTWCVECSREKATKQYMPKYRVKKFFSRSGITQEAFDQQLYLQNDLCATCKKHKDGFTDRGSRPRRFSIGPDLLLRCAFCHAKVMWRHQSDRRN